MAKEFNLTPRRVNPVQTPFRRIATELPVPESMPMLETLARLEPVAMRGQPPVVWDHAEGFQVWDAYGNCWVDWSSGVLITNAGHGRAEVREAIVRQANQKLLTTYCFPNEARVRLLERLAGVLPPELEKIFLLTTGSEAVECAIKLSRTWGVRQGGRSKHVIVSFTNAFHGRTLGSQQVGGTPALKEWIVNLDPGFVQIPFPDGIWSDQVNFESFERQLHERGIEPQNVAGVILETYQGGTAAFAPRAYMQALRQWCTGHKALLVCDEVQAGFGRTGTLWGFEHYGIVPDLTTFGKGISSSLPLSAVAGRADVMDQFPPGAMTSTHTGNPVCCAAALASLEVIVKENLAANACALGERMHARLAAIRDRTPQFGFLAGKGLVAGLIAVVPGTRTPDGEFAWDVVRRSVEKGVLMFSPVGYGGSTVKIAPPLVITREALDDSLNGFEEAVAEAAAARVAQ
ncbi:MAG TPA: aspartate aminotransferase family protein [Bryobacteraceae bacterium]|nr:aspartate aminotransferase family protein [Bryobacteraceae bacterium]